MTEIQELEAAVDRLAKRMKARLRGKYKLGWSGWKDMRLSDLAQKMEAKSQDLSKYPDLFNAPIDLANYAAFYDLRREKLREKGKEND